VIIRQELATDHLATEALERDTFWNLYEPGGAKEHFLVHQLRKNPAYVPELNLVAEIDGEIVGHAMGSRAKVVSDDGVEREVLTFGPLAVKKSVQRGGIGAAIIEEMARIATEMGFVGLITAGDPRYYSKRGFVPAEKYDIHFGGYFVDWFQARELQPNGFNGITGQYFDALLPLVDNEAQAIFDADLPAMPEPSDADRAFWAEEAERFEAMPYTPARAWATEEVPEEVTNI
jgi:predicted N-acetyltransferase YhbS